MFADSDISSCFAEEQWDQSAYAMHMKDLEKICMTVFSICIDYIFPTKICLPLLMHRKDRDLERRLGLAHFQSSQLR